MVFFISRNLSHIQKWVKMAQCLKIKTAKKHVPPEEPIPLKMNLPPSLFVTLYPNIVVCPREGFKEAGFPKTTDEFVNLTYSQAEIIEYVYGQRDNQLVDINMTEIATIVHGMCVFLEIPDNLGHSNWSLILSTYVSTQIYLVERGQELCIAYGECPNKAEVIEIGDEQGMTNWVRFKAIKKIKVER